MNKVNLKGRLARDPKQYKTESGISSLFLTIALWKGKNKEGKDMGAEFIDVAAFRKKADSIASLDLKKGQIVEIKARLINRKFSEKDYRIAVVLTSLNKVEVKSNEVPSVTEIEKAPATDEDFWMVNL